jgi:hypothetical protein
VAFDQQKFDPLQGAETDPPFLQKRTTTMTLFTNTSKFLAAATLSLAVSAIAMAPVAEAAMMKKNDKMMMHKCKKGDKKCEMKMMKMKHK